MSYHLEGNQTPSAVADNCDYANPKGLTIVKHTLQSFPQNCAKFFSRPHRGRCHKILAFCLMQEHKTLVRLSLLRPPPSCGLSLSKEVGHFSGNSTHAHAYTHMPKPGFVEKQTWLVAHWAAILTLCCIEFPAGHIAVNEPGALIKGTPFHLFTGL